MTGTPDVPPCPSFPSVRNPARLPREWGFLWAHARARDVIRAEKQRATSIQGRGGCVNAGLAEDFESDQFDTDGRAATRHALACWTTCLNATRGKAMPESPRSISTHHRLARRPCPRCGWDISVTGMMPKRQDRGRLVSECPMCEHFEGPPGERT
jgi:hypothetical protein